MTENYPKVSIIMPTYNRGVFIGETIESVISQTFQDWELIIVDDGSTDNTDEVVGRYLSDERIVYLHSSHVGRSRARNQALALTRGEYISYLDSDDLFLPKKLEKQLKWFSEHPETDMVYTSALVINDDGDFLDFMYHANESGNIYEKVAMYLPLVITLPSVMVRRAVQDVVGGFDDELDRFEDTDMWRRISRDYRVDGIPEPLIKVRTHTGNRLDNLDPGVVFGQVVQYISKVFREDGEGRSRFLSEASARLLLHYGQAMATVPGWEEWEKRFYKEALKYQPIDSVTHKPMPRMSVRNRLEAFGGKSWVRRIILRAKASLPNGVVSWLKRIWTKLIRD